MGILKIQGNIENILELRKRDKKIERIINIQYYRCNSSSPLGCYLL